MHALINRERQKRIRESDVAYALSEILALGLDARLPDPHIVAAVAREHTLPGSDAAYLALAAQQKLPLAAADARLRKAARAAKLLWRPGN